MENTPEIYVKTDMPEELAQELLQKSMEWYEERKGRFTSSAHHKLVGDKKRDMTPEELTAWKAANPKSTAKTMVDPKLLSDGAMTYVLEVAGEILTGISADKDISFKKEVQWGVLYEPEARKLYERVSGLVVQEVGIKHLKGNDYVAGSPDGLIGNDGGVEFKCPFTNHNHLRNLMLETVADLKDEHPDYYWQCISGILINQRQFWDFVSYSPNFKGSSQIKIIRINAREVMDDIRLLATKLKVATLELVKIVNLFKEEEI